MIQDVHSHTYYSFCGKDAPEAIVEAAIAGDIELFGICDHNYGVIYGEKSIFKSGNEFSFYDCNRSLKRYYDHICLIKEKYSRDINILAGIEVASGVVLGLLYLKVNLSYGGLIGKDGKKFWDEIKHIKLS